MEILGRPFVLGLTLTLTFVSATNRLCISISRLRRPVGENTQQSGRTACARGIIEKSAKLCREINAFDAALQPFSKNPKKNYKKSFGTLSGP